MGKQIAQMGNANENGRKKVDKYDAKFLFYSFSHPVLVLCQPGEQAYLSHEKNQNGQKSIEADIHMDRDGLITSLDRACKFILPDLNYTQ